MFRLIVTALSMGLLSACVGNKPYRRWAQRSGYIQIRFYIIQESEEEYQTWKLRGCRA
jgi:hypothetical protein